MLETAHFLEVYLPPDLSEHLFYSDSNMQYERMQMLKVLPNRHVTPNTNQQQWSEPAGHVFAARESCFIIARKLGNMRFTLQRFNLSIKARIKPLSIKRF